MKIALVSDEWHPVNQHIEKFLRNLGKELHMFGAYNSHGNECWVEATSNAAQDIVSGNSQEGIFLCWSGTGTTIVANKFVGIRAALCNDPETAKLARIWNHANVITLSNRTLNNLSAELILSAWFEDYNSNMGLAGVEKLTKIEQKLRGKNNGGAD